jgi:hypothetical protein
MPRRPSFLWHPSSDPADRGRIQPASLLHRCKNVYSQRGDDGIIAEIFSRLGIEHGCFVEFGAWDGVYLANSRALVERQWNGVFIEADPAKFEKLRRNYVDCADIRCINEWVGHPGDEGRSIDDIASEHLPGREIDFMSIDIDGLEYRILETMALRPKAMCIEGGFAWNPAFTKRVPDAVARNNLAQPLSVMIDVGRGAGYVPVCFNQNVFLVRSDLSEPFSSIRNDALTLWRDAWFNESDAFRSDLLAFRSRNPLVRGEEGLGFLDLPIHHG